MGPPPLPGILTPRSAGRVVRIGSGRICVSETQWVIYRNLCQSYSSVIIHAADKHVVSALRVRAKVRSWVSFSNTPGALAYDGFRSAPILRALVSEHVQSRVGPTCMASTNRRSDG